MPDALFELPRLAAVYDSLDPDRSDLEVYAAIAAEVGARSVLDVGCGTGTFGCLLASRGFSVVGVDPASAMLDVAQAKPGAAAVRWLHGDATSLVGAAGPRMQVDLATMTGNVAQVFLTDEQWSATLRGVHAALRPGGRLVFETRDPAKRAWLGWTREQTYKCTDVPGIGLVESWEELTDVHAELVSFRSLTRFEVDGVTLASHSTLRFRERAEIEESLAGAGFALDEVRGAPDRPGLEMVFIARRNHKHSHHLHHCADLLRPGP